MATTVRLRFGWVVLGGVFAVSTVGTLGLVVAELRYTSEQLVALQHRQEALERRLVSERARGSSAQGEADLAEARERAALERLGRLEAVVRALEERAGKAQASDKPEVAPAVSTPPRAVTPAPRARPQLKAPRLADARPPAPSSSDAPAASEPSPKPPPGAMRRAEREPEPKLFAEPAQPAQPIADRRLGL